MSGSDHTEVGFRHQTEAPRFEKRVGAVGLLTDKHKHRLFLSQN